MGLGRTGGQACPSLLPGISDVRSCTRQKWGGERWFPGAPDELLHFSYDANENKLGWPGLNGQRTELWLSVGTSGLAGKIFSEAEDVPVLLPRRHHHHILSSGIPNLDETYVQRTE